MGAAFCCLPTGAFLGFETWLGVDLALVLAIAFLTIGTLFFSSFLTTLVTLTTLA